MLTSRCKLNPGVWLLLVIIAGSALGGSAKAATAGGITIAPAKIDLSIRNDTAEASTYVEVKNNFAARVALNAEVRSVDTSHGVLVPNARTSLHGDTIAVSPSDFELAAGESRTVQVLVKGARNLKPGGNYAALLIRQQDPSSGAISLTPAISVSLFITKEEGAVRRLASTMPHVPVIALRLPVNLTATFNNTGNVLLVPRGSMSISRGNSITHKTVVNESSISVFPGKTVRLQNTLSPIASTGPPGRRTITYTYRYDGSAKDTETLTATFWYLPWWSIAPVPVLIFGILLAAKATRSARRRRQKRQKHRAHAYRPRTTTERIVKPTAAPAPHKTAPAPPTPKPVTAKPKPKPQQPKQPAHKPESKPKTPIKIKDLEPPPTFKAKPAKPRPPKKIAITDKNDS